MVFTELGITFHYKPRNDFVRYPILIPGSLDIWTTNTSFAVVDIPGILHCTTGPAIIWPKEYYREPYYYVDGVEINFEEWHRRYGTKLGTLFHVS
jgi:hypothetical protein